MARIRVLVAEDSATVRGHLVEVLSADPGIEVVGQAIDGRQAAALCRELRPHVVTLDLAMPVLDGLAVTEQIMAHCPTPILIISGSHERGALFKTYDALVAGAIEVLEKPTGAEPAGSWERNLLSMVRMVARIKVITHLRGRISGQHRHSPESADIGAPHPPLSGQKIVAIGTSTGGPAALTAVLSALPAGYPWPIVVVIHLSLGFGTSFVHWLAQQVQLPVAMAEDGQRLSEFPGRILVARPDRHLVVRDGRLHYSDDPPLHSCRPAVDMLFLSLARERGAEVIACLLTGMGRDGAQGLLAIRRAGGMTIAEDESTSVVFGMPGEAVRLEAALMVLPVTRIGRQLLELAELAPPGGRA